MALSVGVVCFLLVVQWCYVSAEVLSNGDFESTNYNGNWYASGCHGASSNDAYHGQHSYHVSGRARFFNGIGQNVTVQAGSYYKTTFYVKLLDAANNKPYQRVDLQLVCNDQTGRTHLLVIARTPNVRPGEWTQVGGVEEIYDGYHECHIYIQTDSTSDFLVDSATMVQVPYDPSWKEKANTLINQHRKADLNFGLSGTVPDSTTLQLEIIQKKREFLFGSAVRATDIVDSLHHAYQQAFYDNFEYAVLENALKWRNMEQTKGHINYDIPLNAINSLRAHGVKVGGHYTFTSGDGTIPNFVKAMSSAELTTAIHDRIQGVIGRTKGLLEMWDVNYENLQGDFYERHTGNPDITMDMFRQVHAVDPHPKLFLNDDQVISMAVLAVALKEKALRFKKHGVPIGAIGVQGHMHNYDIEAVKARLDILAEAGLPIIITELGVHDDSDQARAQRVDDLLTLFYSHPAVEGVIFWGFATGHIRQNDAALFHGRNVTANAAGLAYQRLVKHQWNTHNVTDIHGDQQVHIRGFKGDYTLNVKHNGQIIHTEEFSLSDGGKTIDIHLGAQSGGHPTVANVVVG